MFLLLFVLWLLLNGRVTWEIVWFGLGATGLCYGAACVLCGFSLKKDAALLRCMGGILRLLGHLWLEMMKANAATIRMIYGRRQPSPTFVSFDAPVHSPAAQAALANCITLTPGTMTARIENGRFTVHCLDESLAHGLCDSPMAQALGAIEKRRQKK